MTKIARPSSDRHARAGGHPELPFPAPLFKNLPLKEVVVREQYFPGWLVETGDGWKEVHPTPEGLLQARVEKGRKEIRFHFSELRGDRFIGWVLSAIALGVMFCPREWGRVLRLVFFWFSWGESADKGRYRDPRDFKTELHPLSDSPPSKGERK